MFSNATEFNVQFRSLLFRIVYKHLICLWKRDIIAAIWIMNLTSQLLCMFNNILYVYYCYFPFLNYDMNNILFSNQLFFEQPCPLVNHFLNSSVFKLLRMKYCIWFRECNLLDLTRYVSEVYFLINIKTIGVYMI